MTIEIDQSGKVEATSVNTIISDSLGNSLKINTIDKRLIQNIYRQSEKPRVFVYEIFCLSVAFLIKKSFNLTNFYVIDIEYFGQNDYLRSLIMIYLKKLKLKIRSDQIRFSAIGKDSPAHQFAYKRFKSKRDRGESLKVSKLVKILFPKKTDRVLVNA